MVMFKKIKTDLAFLIINGIILLGLIILGIVRYYTLENLIQDSKTINDYYNVIGDPLYQYPLIIVTLSFFFNLSNIIKKYHGDHLVVFTDTHGRKETLSCKAITNFAFILRYRVMDIPLEVNNV